MIFFYLIQLDYNSLTILSYCYIYYINSSFISLYSFYISYLPIYSSSIIYSIFIISSLYSSILIFISSTNSILYPFSSSIINNLSLYSLHSPYSHYIFNIYSSLIFKSLLFLFNSCNIYSNLTHNIILISSLHLS